MDKYISGMKKLKASDELKEKIIFQSMKEKRFNLFFRKKVVLAMVCLIAIVSIFSIPYYYTNNSSEVFSMRVYAENNRELKQNVELLLAEYNPAMSIVPGCPFKISYVGADIIKVESSEGKLLLWDKNKTNKVTEKGNEYFLNSEQLIYWSPLNNQTLVDKTDIIITAYKDDKEVSKKIIKIYSNGDINYYAKLAK